MPSGDGLTLDEIVARLGGELRGQGSFRVSQVATLQNAGPEHISFLANPKYRAHLNSTRAGAVVLPPSAAGDFAGTAILVRDPYLYFARVSQLLNPPQRLAEGVHPRAVVDSELPASVRVGPRAVIGANVCIGENASIGPGCVIGSGVEIGPDAILHAAVTIYSGCRIGARAIVHSGAVIGSDGFGFAREQDGTWFKIPQIGRVVVGDDVEIGANTTIDRGALDDTIIEDGVKLDNQIQIGHNCRIGARTAIAGCVGIAGSTQIGSRCQIGGAAMIIGHLSIADDVIITAGSFVGKSIPAAGMYTGQVPSQRHEVWRKNFAQLRHLDALADKISALENRLGVREKKL
ncbi:MAG: UDP-3-O-(3-hydroxymyristoyl)glucosamine N-acyltransferase [Rhodocyclaceae bacterium]